MPVRRRKRDTTPRLHRVVARYSDEEWAAVEAAAAAADLTPSGWVAMAGLHLATGAALPPAHRPVTAEVRSALAELVMARAESAKAGSNLNQAVRAFNASGEAPEFLARAIVSADRALVALGAAADTIESQARR